MKNLATGFNATIFSFILMATSASAQMVASDDIFSLKLGEVLEIEAPGILDNDLLNEESAPEMGVFARTESFEDEAAFEPAHWPNNAPVVTNMGISWTTNHPDQPVSNGVSVASGPARTGQWAPGGGRYLLW